MRKAIEQQTQLGEVGIPSIQFNMKSRDDIVQILLGLQHLYHDQTCREEIFALLDQLIPAQISREHGRPGMHLWKILVLGTLRLNLNCDYDRIHDLANNHIKIQQMLGHGSLGDQPDYGLQTIKDNVSLFTPEILDQINQVVVKAGHQLVKKKEGEVLQGKCDSFVVETDVHFPTDISLLFDACRKALDLASQVCRHHELTDLRQSRSRLRRLKRQYHRVRKAKHSTSKHEEKQQAQHQSMMEMHEQYLQEALSLIEQVRKTVAVLRFVESHQAIAEIESYLAHADRQVDQIRRRVLWGEVIPHGEKVFSVFEPHTEWISKGKAGVPVELGLRVCILDDQYGFILHHHVMEHQTDDQVAVFMVQESQRRFPELNQCSFDQGFHSPENQRQLRALLEHVILPKKGRLSKAQLLHEGSERFIQAKRQHSAVESAMNALEVHGLDVCPDHGFEGYKRYVALAIVSRNIQKLGAIIRDRNRQRWRPAGAQAA
jgi:IS5 family transposase